MASPLATTFELSSDLVTQPEIFAGENKDLAQKLLHTIKDLFEFGKARESRRLGKLGQFKELYVDGFDEEQIWEQIQLQNEPLHDYSEVAVEKLVEDGKDIDLEALIAPHAKQQKVAPVSSELDVDEGESNGSTWKNALNAHRASKRDQNFDSEEEGEDDEFEEDGEDDFDVINASDLEGSDDDEGAGDDDELDDGLNSGEPMDEDEEAGVDGSDEDEENLNADGEEDIERRWAEDDLFFNEDDMEQFLEDAEKEARGEKGIARKFDEDDTEAAYDYVYGEDNVSDDDVDHKTRRMKKELDEDDDGYYGNDGEDDYDSFDATSARYDNFFAAPSASDDEDDGEDLELDEELEAAGVAGPRRGAGSDLFSAGEEKEETGHALSKHEALQAKLKKQIGKLEAENIAVKEWMMAGEAKAKERPENSLLEEPLEFEHASKPAPVITQEVTSALEDIIKGRIRDGAFDDPIRKIAPPDRGDFRSRSIQLDTEKSSKGLAEIYEQDYLNQTQAQLGSLPSGDAAQMTELQQQAVKLFKRICFKLDALANANFTPLKFKDDEVDIKKLNVAAIRMEEVTPTTVSEAVVLAPEEIYRKTKSGGNLVGESEMTKEDRKRKRRRHKEAGKKHNAEKASKAKVAERLGEKKRLSDKDAMAQIKEIRNVRIAEQTDTTQYTNSAQVFKKLQESANNPQANTKSRRPAHAPTGQIAANLKL